MKRPLSFLQLAADVQPLHGGDGYVAGLWCHAWQLADYHRQRDYDNTCERGTDTQSDASMTIESIPKFTGPAAKLWATIPSHSKKLLLSNVWCGKCRHAVTITNFSGVIKAGDLLLVGLCSECHGDVARVIETGKDERLE